MIRGNLALLDYIVLGGYFGVIILASAAVSFRFFDSF